MGKPPTFGRLSLSLLALLSAPDRSRRSGANLLITGLLYLLCFERVDNLGAYSIPSETGLLIPSDYNSYFRVILHSGHGS